MIFRDYMYLDTNGLQNYISSLDPGTIDELTEVERRQTAGEGKAGLSLPGLGEAGGGGSHEKETTQQRSMKITPQNMFSRIYDVLSKDGAIRVFDDEDILYLDSVQKREVVEITREFAPSPMNELIDKVFRLMETMKSLGFVEEVNDPETQEAIQGLAMIFRGEEGSEEVPMVARAAPRTGDASIVFVAKSEFFLVNQDDFKGEMTVFGRVKRVIPANDYLDLFDFLKIPRELARDENIKSEILTLFESWPKELGGPVSKSSLHVPGPVVIVKPLAVYEA